jgi:hypothetical protein
VAQVALLRPGFLLTKGLYVRGKLSLHQGTTLAGRRRLFIHPLKPLRISELLIPSKRATA